MTVTSSKPAARTSGAISSSADSANWPGFPGLWRLLQPAFDQHRRVRRRPGVAVCRRPRGEREWAPCAEHAPGLAQGAGRIRHEHVAEAGDDRVDARVRQVDLLHVHDAVLRVRDSATPSRLDHHRRKVGRDHARHQAGNRLGDVAGAGGKVEHHVRGLRAERGEKRIGDRRVDRRDKLALGLPAGCGGVPAPPDVVGRLYAATPLNSGRMSRP